MREDEPEKVRDKLAKPPLELKIRIIRSAGRFLKAVADEPLADEKRKKFRETFYQVLKEEADKFGCEYLVHRTIAPDWIETQGGIKTQHNVLEQVGINPHARYGFKLLEPLSELYKDQDRSLTETVAEAEPCSSQVTSVKEEATSCARRAGRLLRRLLLEATSWLSDQLNAPQSTGRETYKDSTRLPIFVKAARRARQYMIKIR